MCSPLFTPLHLTPLHSTPLHLTPSSPVLHGPTRRTYFAFFAFFAFFAGSTSFAGASDKSRSAGGIVDAADDVSPFYSTSTSTSSTSSSSTSIADEKSISIVANKDFTAESRSHGV